MDETTQPDITTEPIVAPETPPPADEPPKYRLIARERLAIEVELTAEERAAASERANERGERVYEIEREIDWRTESWRDWLKARKVDLDEAKAAHKSALDARHTGREVRHYDAERRAMIAQQTIDLVRLDTDETVESRPMTEAEQARHCRQGTIEEVTGGAEIAPTPQGEPEPPPESDERTTTGSDRPIGWPVAWAGKVWVVQVDGEPTDLEESGVLEVYLRTPESEPGLKVGELVTKIPWMTRQAIARALALLGAKGLAYCGEGKRWRALAPGVSGTSPSPEPGRADPLPEAETAPRPRMTEPQTKADVLLAQAGETATVWGVS